MGLKEVKKNIYLKVKEGRIAMRNLETNSDELYKSVSGVVTAVNEREAEINGERIKFLEINIDSDGENFILSVPKNGSLARTIILSLASIEDFKETPVEFIPYKKDGYTNITVHTLDGNKLPWVCSYEELPAVKPIKLSNGKEVIDDGARQSFLEEMLNQIRQTLAVVNDEEDIEDDMPDE